ncbi:hypothetical protein BASA50_010727 [Batrachochytrium salamandrivorans]|uniref:Protein kinase domain-containing protein n=1 Tax=Batrachochytrium salamandrivorans TaxID=1357716 RepID=A0ABQ8EXS1_9FUNG|nr:hypothetical protein BASA50_010727 [Batrachochytrium salamandrivorans]
MNLPWNHKSDSSDAAGSSKSSIRTRLRSAWNKRTKGSQSPDVQVKRRTSSEENLSDPKDTHEGQQGIDNTLSEENDTSPITHGSQEIQHAYSSGTSPSNGEDGPTSETDVEREEKEKILQKKVSTSYLEYAVTGQGYSLARALVDFGLASELAKIELREKCAQFEMAAYYHKTAVYELDIFKRGTGDTIFGKMTKRPSLEDQDCKELGIELKKLLADDVLPDLTKSLKESGYVFSQQDPPSTQ